MSIPAFSSPVATRSPRLSRTVLGLALGERITEVPAGTVTARPSISRIRLPTES